VKRRTKILGVGSVAVGIIAATVFESHLQSTPADPRAQAPAGRAADLAAIAGELDALNAALDEERSRRAALELELAALRQDLADTEAAGESDPGAAPADPTEKPSEPAGGPSTATPRGREWFDAAALRERGIEDRHAEYLRERFEALQMEELYIRDQAAREGWLNQPRHHQEMQRLREEARENLGAEDFDWLLYASGRNNRVMVRDVLESSPANAAGIRSGDLILRYDDVVVLQPTDLTTATTKGEFGSGVAVEIQRGGDVQRLYVSRGPLGARIAAVRRPPLAAP
jgi:hypothetical protein